jgi:hypothetical protein
MPRWNAEETRGSSRQQAWVRWYRKQGITRFTQGAGKRRIESMMMTAEDIRLFRENTIRRTVAAQSQSNYCYWKELCCQVWVLDVVLNESLKTGYVYPEQRFPFQERQEAAK